MRARVTAKNAVITNEINQLDMAVRAYKEKYGDYPPDFTQQEYPPVQANDWAAVTLHLQRAFPRYPGRRHGGPE